MGPVKVGLPTAWMNKTKTNDDKTNNTMSSDIWYYTMRYGIYNRGFEYSQPT